MFISKVISHNIIFSDDILDCWFSDGPSSLSIGVKTAISERVIVREGLKKVSKEWDNWTSSLALILPYLISPPPLHLEPKPLHLLLLKLELFRWTRDFSWRTKTPQPRGFSDCLTFSACKCCWILTFVFENMFLGLHNLNVSTVGTVDSSITPTSGHLGVGQVTWATITSAPDTTGPRVMNHTRVNCHVTGFVNNNTTWI